MDKEKQAVEKVKQALWSFENTVNEQKEILGEKRTSRIKGELDAVWSRIAECPGW